MPSLEYLSAGLPLSPLPINRGRNNAFPHAPKRLHQLNPEQKVLAISNALRYFPRDLHSLLKKEFEQELEDYGHIYMYRFKADLPPARNLRWQAFKARNLHCAAMMLQICNNLSVEIAQYPEELVTYGGNGQCLANWAQFWILMQALSRQQIGQTLVLSSSHTQGVFPSELDIQICQPENAQQHWIELQDGFRRGNLQPLRSPQRPMMQISNGLCIPNYSSSSHYSNYFALGVSNYGQMTAGSFCYIGPQGIVHGTTITLLNASAQRLKSGPASVPDQKPQKRVIPIGQEIAAFPFSSPHIVQSQAMPISVNGPPLVYLSSGLGGMSGAQTKAGLIAKVISVIAEVRPEPIIKRFNQKWVNEIITDLDLLIDRIRQLKLEGQVSSIAYFGNIVDVWERLASLHKKNKETLVDMASDQTSCHDVANGGYIPQGVSLEELNEIITNNPKKFSLQVGESLRNQVKAINYLSNNTGLHFWDYGNAFLLEAVKAGADLMSPTQKMTLNEPVTVQNIVNLHLRYQSYIETIMGDIFSLGFGPFRWICSSNQDTDLALTDCLAEQVLREQLNEVNARLVQTSFPDKPRQLLERKKLQLESNLRWIVQASDHDLVVGTRSRILYADREGREKIALKINQAIRAGFMQGPVVLSRDHHDVSSVDSPFRETSNITDGSKFTADMAIQNAIGLASRGVTWVAIHNGGGVGFGESINGGFGLVLDGTRCTEETIQLALHWDVNNGVSRRAWAGNENAIGIINEEMNKNEMFNVVCKNDVDPAIFEDNP